MKWKDKRDVMLLTTRHTDKVVTTGKRDRQGNDICKPEAILFYNGTKQGIDVSDQMSAYHTCLRKTVRWYHKVAIELICGTAVVNAMQLYNGRCLQMDKRCVSITAFRERLVGSLLEVDGQNQIEERSSTRHYLRETALHESGKRSDRRRRRYRVGCYRNLKKSLGRNLAKSKTKRLTTECSGCVGNPAFCFECFPKFHE